jgi:hypothetical protein
MDFAARNGPWWMIFTRGCRIYVPASSSLVEELLAMAHDAGHEGT